MRARVFEVYPRAHQLKGAPQVVFKSQRGKLAEGSHRGRASEPSTPSEWDRALPSKPTQAISWISLQTTSLPLSNRAWASREPSDNSSTRNPQFATRSMGVAETSPSVPRRDGEGTYKLVGEPALIASTGPRLGGLDARLHLLGCTKRRRCQIRARDTAEAGWNIADAG
jgi:hypothetical protein